MSCPAGSRRWDARLDAGEARSPAGWSRVRSPGATARPRTGQGNAAFPGKTHRISCSGSRKHTFPLSPPCHGESLCSAGDNVNSYPGNQGKQGRLFGILREAAACLPQQQGLARAGTAALMATNEPLSLAVGWPRRWKICGSPREKKKSQVKTNNCLWGRRREADAIQPFRAWCWFLPSARAGLGSQREPGQCLGRGRAQLCPERYPVGKGCPRGTGLVQEAVSHPAACPGRPQRPLLCQPR